MRRTMPVAFILISSNAVFAMIAMVLFAHKEEICKKNGRYYSQAARQRDRSDKRSFGTADKHMAGKCIIAVHEISPCTVQCEISNLAVGICEESFSISFIHRNNFTPILVQNQDGRVTCRD